jgi:hypothetical protein
MVEALLVAILVSSIVSNVFLWKQQKPETPVDLTLDSDTKGLT